MNNNLIFLGAILLFCLINLVIGLHGFKKATLEDVTTAKNKTTFLPLTISLISTIVGGGMFLGVAEMGFNGGLVFLGVGFIYLFGSIAVALLAPYMRQVLNENNADSLFGLLDAIYPAKTKVSVTFVFALVSLFVYIVMLAAQFVGIVSFYAYFTGAGIFSTSSMMMAFASVVFTTIVYSVFGGLKKDITTDIFQFVVIILGLLGLFFFGDFQKSPTESIKLLQPSDFLLHGKYNVVYLVGALLFIAPTFFVRYDLWQRIITAKSDSVAKASFLTSGIMALFFFLVFGFIGLYAKSIGIDNANFSALEVINKSTHGIVLYLCMFAFFSAVMSSADTFLGVGGLALTQLIWSNEDSSKKITRFRKSAFFIALSSLGIAFLSKDIIELFSISFGLLMVFLPTVFGGILRKSPKSKEAFYSIYSGLFIFIIGCFFAPKESFIPSTIIAIVVYILVAKFNKPTAKTP